MSITFWVLGGLKSWLCSQHSQSWISTTGLMLQEFPWQAREGLSPGINKSQGLVLSGSGIPETTHEGTQGTWELGGARNEGWNRKTDWRSAEENSCWESHIEDLKSIPKMGCLLPKPPKKDKDKATWVTYRELDDLVEHDIGGDVEIEDEILEGKEAS